MYDGSTAIVIVCITDLELHNEKTLTEAASYTVASWCAQHADIFNSLSAAATA